MVKYYTQINDDDFEKNTCGKKEFTKYIWQPSNAQLYPHQQWLANYIGPRTPYKGMLIYHETGVGKTCTAVSIAENFREELVQKGKKINILCSANIMPEWIRTIANPTISGKTVDCTGSTYYDMASSNKIEDVNKEVLKFYEFSTHGTWGSSIIKAVKDKSLEDKKVYIKQHYSDSVIIVDEAQHLRSKFEKSNIKDGKDGEEKKSHDAIDLLSKYADNVKVIFLTATPMFDNPTEIIWIINVLIRINKDDIPELTDRDIFEDERNEYKFRPGGKEKFIRALKGKVSFLRSGNPENFPIKLYDKNATDQFPLKSFNDQQPIQNTQSHHKSLQVTLSQMCDEHHQVVEKLREYKKNKGQTDSFHMQQMQVHNVRWYKQKEKSEQTLIDDAEDGDGGLGAHFIIDQKNSTYEPKVPNVLNELEKWAPKIQNIINQISEMKEGIAYIFSQFVSAGIIPMMLALEANGYSKFTGEKSSFNHLKISNNKKSKVDNGRYLVITSSKKLSDQSKFAEYTAYARSMNNINGEKIKVIIASGTGAEGIDLKFIRQVHIMEPHFHFSQIEQAVGRAIRNNSHKELDVEKRNCTIYYHATQYPDEVDVETVDMHLYRIAMGKRKATQRVRKIIQENSITCAFFKQGNTFDFTKLIGTKVKDSKGHEEPWNDDMKGDEGYSHKCNTCIKGSFDSDHDTYDPMLHSRWEVYSCITFIQELFSFSDKYSLQDIILKCKSKSKTLNDETIFAALDILINTGRTFQNQFSVQGRLTYYGSYYHFYPIHFENSGISSGIPLTLSTTTVSLADIPWPLRPNIDDTSTLSDQNIEAEFTRTLSLPLFNNEPWSRIESKGELLASVLIDKMTSKSRLNLYNSNSLTHPSLISALRRYERDGGILDVTHQTTEPVVNIKIIKKDGSIIKDKNVINPYSGNNAKPIKSNTKLYGCINGRGDFYAVDKLKSNKSNGYHVLPAKRGSSIIPLVNKLVQMKPNDSTTPIMKYDRYVNDNKIALQPGQYHAKGAGRVKTEDIIIELEMFFRYYESISDDTVKWWLDSWDSVAFKTLLNVKFKEKKPKKGGKRGGQTVLKA